jgi:Na+/H+-dicarboxylate symporter
MKKIKLGLLAKIAIAIVLGIACGLTMPGPIARIFITINQIFGSFLGFFIPLLIFGLIAPGIADLGRSAGRLLLYTVMLAYGFTIFSGYFSFFTSTWLFPKILEPGQLANTAGDPAMKLTPYFTIDIPPVMSVMTALVFAFTVGIGVSKLNSEWLKNTINDFKEIVNLTINKIIIPLLPLYIFGIFWEMTVSGQVQGVIGVFLKIIVIIFIMSGLLLLIQFSLAGIISGKNPLRMLKTMLPAYVTALGTQSSAATIPVTVRQALKNNIREDIVDFVIPLCATIHLSGSTLKIVACSLAIMLTSGMSIDIMNYSEFIFMLGITMVAAPGVPGGAIMAALGILQSILGFDQTACGLMIALYIAMDSFGTATNVTGDASIAAIIDKIYSLKSPDEKS